VIEEEPAPDVEFDDFAALPPSAATEPPPAPPVPRGRTLVRTFGGPAPAAPSRRRTGILAGAGVVVAGLAVVPFFAGPEQVAGHASPAALVAQPANSVPSPGPAPDVHLELDRPADLGDRVRLSWRADGDLDFAVVVAGERLEPRTLVAYRRHAMEVPVDRTRRYCFQIRATDGRHVYTSTPVPLRGGQCTT
jgi:hypothetical protein